MIDLERVKTWVFYLYFEVNSHDLFWKLILNCLVLNNLTCKIYVKKSNEKVEFLLGKELVVCVWFWINFYRSRKVKKIWRVWRKKLSLKVQRVIRNFFSLFSQVCIQEKLFKSYKYNCTIINYLVIHVKICFFPLNSFLCTWRWCTFVYSIVDNTWKHITHFFTAYFFFTFSAALKPRG